MQLGMIGLGKMGANIVRRLRRNGISVVGYNRSNEITQQLAKEEGMIPAASLAELIHKCPPPRYLWLMVPAGDATESTLQELRPLLQKGDVVIDGGNSNYHDSLARHQQLHAYGIGFLDIGTSGGIWGLEKGYCLMIGGDAQHVAHLAPIFRVLAADGDHGWAHVGPVGSGHFTKMIHNGIEYGMMQSFAEGLSLLRGKKEFNLDLAQITDLWRHGSVVRSWLLDLTSQFLMQDQSLEGIAPHVADSGEGRWTIDESIRQGIPAPVLALSLYMRFASQDSQEYGNRLLAMMRNAFGGHHIKEKSP